MHKELILENLKQSKELLKQQFHIERIGLFGSYSIGSQNEASDVDLIVEFERGKRLVIKELYDLEQFLSKALRTEKIDIVNRAYINPLIENEMEKSLVYV